MEKDKIVSDAKEAARVDTTVSLLLSIGDTTWRMFVPSVGLTLVGVWLDATLGLKPWLMVAGIISGLFFAGLLVKLQIDRSKSNTKPSRSAVK